jgi:hypothetical protein
MPEQHIVTPEEAERMLYSHDGREPAASAYDLARTVAAEPKRIRDAVLGALHGVQGQITDAIEAIENGTPL